MTPVETTESAPPGEAETEPQAPGRRRRLLLWVGTGLVLTAALGVGGLALIPRGSGPGTKPPKAAQARVAATVPVGAVVVNLAGETRRYLRVAMELGVPAVKDVKEVEARKPQILDLLITVLGAKELEALATPAGRAALREELLAGIRAEAGLARVARVYFTEFVIQ